MKIALQITSLISTAKSSAHPASNSGPEFRSAFTAAVESSSERGSKSNRAEDARKKTTPSQPAPTEQPVTAAPQDKVIPAIVPQQAPLSTSDSLLPTDNSLDPADGFSISGTVQAAPSASASAGCSATLSPISSSIVDLIPQAATQTALVAVDVPLGMGTATATAANDEMDGDNTPSSASQAGHFLEGSRLPSAATDLPSQPVAQGTDGLKETHNPVSILPPTKEKQSASAIKGQGPDSDALPKRVQNSNAEDSSAASASATDDASTTANQMAALPSPSTAKLPPSAILSTSGPEADLSVKSPKAPNQNTIGALNDTPSSKAGSSVKGKASSDPKFRSGSDAESNADAQSAVAGNSVVAKAPEATPLTNANANASEIAKESGLLQQVAQAGPATATDHAQSAPQSFASAPADTVHNQTSVAATNAAVETIPSVSSAQLIQSMHHSEMRLGMQSEEFGNLSISTSLNHQALTAQISTDHSELSRALAMHLPSIEEKLGSAYGVQARVELREGIGNSASSYSNSGQQSKDNRESRGNSTTGSTVAIERMSALTSSTTAPAAASGSRLDIRI